MPGRGIRDWRSSELQVERGIAPEWGNTHIDDRILELDMKSVIGHGDDSINSSP